MLKLLLCAMLVTVIVAMPEAEIGRNNQPNIRSDSYHITDELSLASDSRQDSYARVFRERPGDNLPPKTDNFYDFGGLLPPNIDFNQQPILFS